LTPAETFFSASAQEALDRKVRRVIKNEQKHMQPTVITITLLADA
jgi:hypothetical protein